MLFNRWQCAWPRTWPYALFKKHHTELNDYYWSSKAAGEQAILLASGTSPSSPISSVLAISAANARRISFSKDEWLTHFRDFQNWNRLNALMALKGYLETYVHGVASLALNSDPGLLISSSKAVDGISLIKKGTMPDINSYIMSLTKGSWQDRVSSYHKIFGHTPTALSKHVVELNTMQKLRNGVGHSFGRDISDYRNLLLFKPLPVQRLSEVRLQKWLGIVEEVVNDIEEHLRPNHIGAIEVLMHYHMWDKKYPAGHMSEERAFRAKFPDAQGNPPSAAYFRDVINHYRIA